MDEATNLDPVLVKREKIRTRVVLGKRIGYTLMTLSIVCVFACVPLGWPTALVWVAMVSFTASCVILPLPIIFGYAVKAAEREDKKMGL